MTRAAAYNGGSEISANFRLSMEQNVDLVWRDQADPESLTERARKVYFCEAMSST